MNSWEPINLEELHKQIDESVSKMNPFEKNLWNAIRLSTPEKWIQSPLGDRDGGFWVVAIYSKHCIYYEDIEEGFNTSPFTRWGSIDQHGFEQDELVHVIHRLATGTSKKYIRGAPKPLS